MNDPHWLKGSDAANQKPYSVRRPFLTSEFKHVPRLNFKCIQNSQEHSPNSKEEKEIMK